MKFHLNDRVIVSSSAAEKGEKATVTKNPDDHVCQEGPFVWLSWDNNGQVIKFERGRMTLFPCWFDEDQLSLL